MKKAITALALLAPFGLVQAQSSVTIFGNMDAAVVSVNPGHGTTTPGGSVATAASGNSTPRLDSGVGPGSRIGFRGTEDLGGGLRANFMLEGGIAVDTGGSQQGGLIFGRQSFVGLSGNGWTLSAGRQYAPIDVIFAMIDPQYGLYWGNATTNTNHATYPTIGATPTSQTWQATSRVNNSVLTTYTANGFTAKVMLSAGDENARKTGQLFNPSLTYDNGPLSLSVSATRMRQSLESIKATATPEWISEQIIGGSYDFQVTKVFAGAYQFLGPKNHANFSDAATVGAVGASPYAFTWSKQRSYWTGARTPFDSGTFIASITRIDYLNDVGPDGKGTVLGLVYEYPLSKRTVLYANYGQTVNNAYANGPLVSTVTLVNSNGYGTTMRAAAVGMRHAF